MKDLIYAKIRESGGRMTKIKKALIDVFLESGCLLSMEEIEKKLIKKNIKPEKSTIFRELSSLTSKHLIHKNNISGRSFFELPCSHHHHLVCISCGKIEAIEMKNKLIDIEKNFLKTKNFLILNHVLDFYGYCEKCRND
jgi:Fur family ferric uptake transcriptional regulator